LYYINFAQNIQDDFEDRRDIRRLSDSVPLCRPNKEFPLVQRAGSEAFWEDNQIDSLRGHCANFFGFFFSTVGSFFFRFFVLVTLFLLSLSWCPPHFLFLCRSHSTPSPQTSWLWGPYPPPPPPAPSPGHGTCATPLQMTFPHTNFFLLSLSRHCRQGN